MNKFDFSEIQRLIDELPEISRHPTILTQVELKAALSLIQKIEKQTNEPQQNINNERLRPDEDG